MAQARGASIVTRRPSMAVMTRSNFRANGDHCFVEPGSEERGLIWSMPKAEIHAALPRRTTKTVWPTASPATSATENPRAPTGT